MNTTLIRAEELAQHLGDPDWIILDCRSDLVDHGYGARVYAEGHIPGAFRADLESDLAGPQTGRNGRHPLPDPEVFRRRLESWGVREGRQIVAVDNGNGNYACRARWLVRWIGWDCTAVLDGGMPAWLRAGLPVTREVPAAPAAGSVDLREPLESVVKLDDVVSNLMLKRFTLLDVRGATRYRGETEPIDRVPGHIPGAINFGVDRCLNADMTFRDPKDVGPEMEAALHGRDPKSIVMHCGSGVSVTVALLMWQMAGLPAIPIFDGSYSEWSQHTELPIATGTEI